MANLCRKRNLYRWQHTFYMLSFQGWTDFPEIQEPLQNSRRRLGAPTNFKCHLNKNLVAWAIWTSRLCALCICFMLLQPKSGLGHLVLVSAFIHKHTHTHTHIHTYTHPRGLLWTSDQPVAEAATYPSDSKHNRRTSTLLAELEPSSPAVKGPQIYASDRMVTGIGPLDINRL